MALIRSGQVSEVTNYRLDDYEAQKKAYLQDVAEEGQDIVKKARQQAGKILKEAHSKGMGQAEDEARRMREEASAKGHAEGLEKGRQEGLEEMKKKAEVELKPLMDSLKAMAEGFDRRALQLLDRAEQTLVEASLELAQAVTQVEPSFNPEVLKARLKNALTLLKPGLEMHVSVSPGDRELLEKHLTSHFESEGLSPSVKWSENPEGQSGDFKIRMDDAEVQFNNELQWQSLLEKLKLKSSQE